MDTLTELTKVLQDGGPWALLALTLLAIAWLAKLYIKARDNIEKELKDMAKSHAELLADMVRIGEKQVSSGEALSKEFERLALEVNARGSQLQTLQEHSKRLLRQAGLGDD